MQQGVKLSYYTDDVRGVGIQQGADETGWYRVYHGVGDDLRPG